MPSPDPRKDKSKAGDRDHRGAIGYVIGGLLAVVLLQLLSPLISNQQAIPYSDFEAAVSAGQVREVTVTPDAVEGEFKTPREGSTHFATIRVDPQLAERLSAKGVTVKGAPSGGALSRLISWLGPLVLIYLFWWWAMPKLAGGAGLGGLVSAGRSKAKVYAESDTKVTFADVAGVEEAKVELQEVVNFLRDPKTYGRLGARAPKGILLVGPPGTGKTLLARAVAGEAGVPFFSISGSEFVEMFVGVGAARVRDLFEQARDARRRPSSSSTSWTRWAAPRRRSPDRRPRREGADAQPASGRDGRLRSQRRRGAAGRHQPARDPRPGAVARRPLRPPGAGGPAGQARAASRSCRCICARSSSRRGVDPEQIAALTPGFTGADLANLVNEAALLATRRNGRAGDAGGFHPAIERIVAGLEKRNRLLNPHEREVVAHHEMGHALVAVALPGVDPVQKVSIIPRGVGALGYTMQRPTEDRFLMDARANWRTAWPCCSAGGPPRP